MDEKEMQEKEVLEETRENEVVDLSRLEESHSTDEKSISQEEKEDISSTSTIKENKKDDHHRWSVVLIFVILFVMVGLFPVISKFMSDWKASYRESTSVVDPLNPDSKYDVMVCTLNRSHVKGNLIVSQYLYHYNGRLKKTKTVTETMGKKSDLETTHSLCKSYAKEIEQYEGLDGNCTLNKSSQINTQIVDYKKLDMSTLHYNFEEREGFYPEFSLDESVSSIELLLYEAGYNCSTL